MAKHKVKVMGMVSPNWVHQQTGINFDECYFWEPDYRRQKNRIISDWLQSFNASLQKRIGHLAVEWFPVGISGIGGVFDNRSMDVFTIGLPQSFILVSALYGGEIVYFDHDNPDVRGYPLAGVQKPSEIPSLDVSTSWPVCDYLKQYEHYIDLHGRENVELFVDVDQATGMPMWYLHSPLTIAYRLRGDQLFIDMVENPPLAHRILDVALNTSWQLFQIFESRVGKKIRLLPVAACIATLISPRVYQQWELPRLSQLAQAYSKVRIHSCGPSSHILMPLTGLDNIMEMEVGAGTDIRLTRQLWPSATINYLIDTPKFVFATPDSIRKEVQSVIQQSDGGDLMILWPAETGTSMETIDEIYATVSDYNASISAG